MTNGDRPSSVLLLFHFSFGARYTVLDHRPNASNPLHNPADTDNAPDLPKVGDLVEGRFRILSVLGQGGFGTVYRAHQTSIGRDVALKCMDPTLTSDPIQIERFRREALHISQLCHPNTVTLYDYGQTENGLFYIVMELIEGRSLADLLKYEGGLGSVRTLRIFKHICRSLAEAHHVGIIHRDLKPENILLCDVYREPDFVKVLDFGLAKAVEWNSQQPALTAAGRVFGTPMYMAPEQVADEELTPATDVYALGLLLFETLTGEPPVQGDSRLEVLRMQLDADVPNLTPELSQHPIGALIQHCTQKDPSQRLPNAEALLDALDDLIQSCPPIPPIRRETPLEPSTHADALRSTQPSALEHLQLHQTQSSPPTLIIEINPDAHTQPPSPSSSYETIALPSVPSGEQSYASPNPPRLPLSPLGLDNQRDLLNPDAFCRTQELLSLRAWLRSFLHNDAPRFVSCFGEPGAGKSRLLNLFCDFIQNPQPPLDTPITFARSVCTPNLSHPLDPIRDAINNLLYTLNIDPASFDTEPNPVPSDLELSPRTPNPLQQASLFLQGSNIPTGNLTPLDWNDPPNTPHHHFTSPLFAGLCRILETLSQQHAILFILDDVDQASFATLAFILELHSSLANTLHPVGALLAGRSDALPTHPELNRTLTRLLSPPNPSLLDLPLERLDDERSSQFITHLLSHANEDLILHVRSLSQGNPLFITHILRHLHATDQLVHNGSEWTLASPIRHLNDSQTPESLPPSLLDLLLLRINRTIQRHTSSPRLKSVLQWLALLGQRTPISLLAQVFADTEIHELDLLASEGLVRIDPSNHTVVFDHLLIREALLKEINSLPSAHTLHHNAAHHKLSFYSSISHDPPLLEVAYHFRLAHDLDAWRNTLKQAASQARQSLDRRRARELYLSFLRNLNDQSDPDGSCRLQAWTALGELCENLGELGPAEDYYRLAAQAAAQRGLTLEQTRAMRGRTRVMILQNRLASARPLAEAIVSLAQHTRSHHQQALSLITYTEVVSRIGDQKALSQALQSLTPLIPLLEDPVTRGQTLLHLGELDKRRGNIDLSITHQEEALENFELAGDQQGISDALCALGYHAIQCQDHELASHVLNRALSIKQAIADRQGTGLVLNNMALHAFQQQRWTDARKHIEQALHIFQSIGSQYSLATTLINHGLILAQLRAYDDAEQCYSKALEILRSVGDRIAASACLSNQGLVAINRLDRDRARVLFRQARRLKLEASSTWGMREVLINLAFVACWDGEFQAAERLLTGLLDEHNLTTDDIAVIHTLLGISHIFQGRLQSAVLNLHRALANAEDSNSPHTLAFCRANAAFYAAITRQENQLRKLISTFDNNAPLCSLEPYTWLTWIESMVFHSSLEPLSQRILQSMTIAISFLYDAYGFGDDFDRIRRGALQRR